MTTTTLSNAIRAAAGELDFHRGTEYSCANEIEIIITKHLSPILNLPAGEEAMRAAAQIADSIPGMR